MHTPCPFAARDDKDRTLESGPLVRLDGGLRPLILADQSLDDEHSQKEPER
jgi:hypothetical protein